MSTIHVPPEATVLAMDVHKRSISTAVLEPDSTTVPVDRISTDEEAVARLIRRFDDPSRVWACYEAGPTGYELARVLRGAGMHCEVIAPSLIPTAPGDRVKTDKPRGDAHDGCPRTPLLRVVRADLCQLARGLATCIPLRTAASHSAASALVRIPASRWSAAARWTAS